MFTPGDDYPVAVFAFKATLRIDNKRIIIMLKCYYFGGGGVSLAALSGAGLQKSLMYMNITVFAE